MYLSRTPRQRRNSLPAGGSWGAFNSFQVSDRAPQRHRSYRCSSSGDWEHNKRFAYVLFVLVLVLAIVSLVWLR